MQEITGKLRRKTEGIKRTTFQGKEKRGPHIQASKQWQFPLDSCKEKRFAMSLLFYSIIIICKDFFLNPHKYIYVVREKIKDVSVSEKLEAMRAGTGSAIENNVQTKSIK